jgi:DNA-binding transcriptional regulator YhcF (GntR family)
VSGSSALNRESGSNVKVLIDPDAPLPAFEQVAGQITAMAVSGVLPVGTRLPSIRQLARDLDLAPGTVARAYRELESAGIVATNRRRGTVVVGSHATPDISGLRAAANVLAIRAHQTGTPLADLLDAVEEAFMRRKPVATIPRPSKFQGRARCSPEAARISSALVTSSDAGPGPASPGEPLHESGD